MAILVGLTTQRTSEEGRPGRSLEDWLQKRQREQRERGDGDTPEREKENRRAFEQYPPSPVLMLLRLADSAKAQGRVEGRRALAAWRAGEFWNRSRTQSQDNLHYQPPADRFLPL